MRRSNFTGGLPGAALHAPRKLWVQSSLNPAGIPLSLSQLQGKAASRPDFTVGSCWRPYVPCAPPCARMVPRRLREPKVREAKIRGLLRGREDPRDPWFLLTVVQYGDQRLCMSNRRLYCLPPSVTQRMDGLHRFPLLLQRRSLCQVCKATRCKIPPGMVQALLMPTFLLPMLLHMEGQHLDPTLNQEREPNT